MSSQEVLTMLSSGAITVEQASVMLAANAPKRGITLKVSEKGALSVYGMGRFPVTLYREQWERLMGEAENIKAFIKANDKTLKLKGAE